MTGTGKKMWHAAEVWFLGLQPALQAALISAGTSLALGVFGFSSIWLTAALNRRNVRRAEADKQRLEIYRDALALIEEASAAQRKATSFVQSTARAIELRQDMIRDGQQPIPPSQRHTEFMSLHREASRGASQLMMFLERWAIVERRLKMFRLGFFLRTNRTLTLMIELSGLYSDMLPFETSDGQTVAKNAAFPEEALSQLMEASRKYAYEMGLLDAYYMDLNIEFQGLLLGHLFGKNRLERRDAPDPAQFTLRIDRYDQVMAKFESEPEFKQYAEQERKLRKHYGAHRQSWWSGRRRVQ